MQQLSKNYTDILSAYFIDLCDLKKKKNLFVSYFFEIMTLNVLQVAGILII